ncbi:MAG: AGE family epimerase/isomerase [Candidatus Thorarchaeota archaeon]
MEELVNEVQSELINHILPFWMRLIDKTYGGFFGRVDGNLNIDEKSSKGAVLNSRILWAFSASFNVLSNEEYLVYAHQAYKFLIEKLIDKKFGGLYWSVDFRGHPLDRRKHIYNLAFAVYALSEYYLATHKDEVKSLLIDLFNLIETKGKDFNGYLEEFDEKWNKKSNDLLSEFGINSQRTMNTHLHLLEAYTNLYKLWESNEVLQSIKNIIDIFERKIFSQESDSFKVFFDSEWNSLINLKSYGHDIEATWLINRALDITKIESHSIIEVIRRVGKKVYKEALKSNSIIYESLNGVINTNRIWWAQTEAVIGFINFSQVFGNKTFFNSAINIWIFIKNHLIDKRLEGEWFSKVSGHLKNYPNDNIVDAWKCPYHNTRMCLEVIKRINAYRS